MLPERSVQVSLQIEKDRAMELSRKRTLVLNCASGISGDMTVAALIDLGADTEALMNEL